MQKITITDAYGRTLDNIRISVTAECNYRCIFCHIEGEPLEGPARPGTLNPLLQPSDYEIIAYAAELLGVKSIKLTGGEPLLRKDIVEIVQSISSTKSIEISMTTNGYFLERLAGDLYSAGLKRVNISIHSLKPEKYKFITGVPGLDKVLFGLKAAKNAGLSIKINSVILKDVNQDEVISLADLAHKYNAILQLIELHPVGLGAKFFKTYFYPLSKIEKQLIEMGAKIEYRKLHNRPIYVLPDGQRIEIVKPYANPVFCAGCTRIRIGPFGDLSPCLNYTGPRPTILNILRASSSFEEKVYLVASAIIDLVSKRKPYFMCSINAKVPILYYSNGRYPVLKRFSFPKRKSFEEAKEALKSLLAEREILKSKAR